MECSGSLIMPLTMRDDIEEWRLLASIVGTVNVRNWSLPDRPPNIPARTA